MQDVPKIVRERLKTATPVVNHPDADMLTAFAERSLAEFERAIVLEHLGRCGDCRDVVALAVPAAETMVAPSPARSPWLTWPAIRLAFVAAGFVAVAAIGIMQYQKRQPAMMAYRQASRPQAPALEAPANEARNQTAPPPMVSAPMAKEEKVARASVQRDSGRGADAGAGSSMGSTRVELPAVNMPQASRGVIGSIGGPLSRGPKPPMQWQQNTNAFQNQAPAPPPPAPTEKPGYAGALKATPPSASETVEVSGAAPAINTQAQDLDARQVRSEPAAPQPASNDAVGKAKPALTVETEAASQVQSGAYAATTQELPIERSGGVSGRNFTQIVAEQPMIRWTVTSAGGLQRSFDRGNTWQDVNVNAGAAGGSMEYAVVAKTARAKEKSADKKSVPAALVFHAVTAIGAEVWAGGTGGALYHSSDGGSQWTRVAPSSGGITLMGDIVTLEFSDAQHGKLTTSSGEAWSTADTGQTWVKQ